MPRKTQCISCKHFISMNSCAAKGCKLDYDDNSCKEYDADISVIKRFEDKTKVEKLPVKKKRMFQRPFSFEGRIRRTEYCLSSTIVSIYCLPMEIIDENDMNADFALYWLIFLVPVLWFFIAQGAKRCHDRGNSGWWQFIPFYAFWMLFSEGDEVANSYGEPPK